MTHKKTTVKPVSSVTRVADQSRAENIQSALYQIADAASAMLDMQEFYAVLHRIMRGLMYAENFYVTLYDPVTHLMSAPYFADEAGDTAPAPSKLEEYARTLRAHVLRTGKTLHVSREEIEAGKRQGIFDPMGTPSEDWIGVPLKLGEQVIGSLTVQSYQKGIRYDEQDVQLLEFIAQHIAVALTRACAIDETRQRNAELAIINSVQEGLASRLDMQAIYDLVGDKIREIFNNKDVSIRILDAKTGLLHYPYTFENSQRIFIEPFPFSKRGFGPHALRTRESLMINQNMLQEIEKYGSGIIPGTQMSKSLVMVPLVSGNQGRGLIVLTDMVHEHAFNESDLRLLETLANSMSVALENARLWEEEKLYRKALERELEIGRQIQAGFLPEALPLVDGWEIAAALMSAREVAGDFYDAFDLPDGTIGLVIADVCDKGVGAALFMTLFRSLVRVIANQEYFEQTGAINLTPATVDRLRHTILLTNNYIAETHGSSGMFATLFFGILDPRDGKLAYINGGHEPPLIVHSGRVCETLRKSGPAVGAILDGHFELLETCLQTGDTLFAFTDGVPDCTDPHGAFFGRDRLHEILSHSSASARELVNTIETELRQYIGSANQFDDITLLAVRRA